VRYLADQMHDCFSTTKDTVIAATYILNKAEQYIDGCDGTIDMTVLKRGPELVKIGSHTLDAINEDVLKNELNAFEALTSVSLPFPI
jgi:hypothetical protein